MAINLRGAGGLMLTAASTLRNERLRREEEERARQAELERMRLQQEFQAGQLDKNIAADLNLENIRNQNNLAANRNRFMQDVFMNQTEAANKQTAGLIQNQQNQQAVIQMDKINRPLLESMGIQTPQGIPITDDVRDQIIGVWRTNKQYSDRGGQPAEEPIPFYAQQYRSIAENALQQALSIGDPRKRYEALQKLGDQQSNPSLAQAIQAFMNTDEEGYYNYHAKWSSELLRAQQEAEQQNAVDAESAKNFGAEKRANIMRYLGAGKQARVPW